MANVYYFTRSDQPGGVGSSENPFRVVEGEDGDAMFDVIKQGIQAIEDAMSDTEPSIFTFGSAGGGGTAATMRRRFARLRSGSR